MKKIGLTIAGLALAGIMALGVNNNLENKGDTWSPQRPDLAYSEGHTDGSPADNKGDTWSPQRPDLAYSDSHEGHADLHAPAYNKGDTPAPQA